MLDFGSGTQTLGNEGGGGGALLMGIETDIAYYPDTLEYYIGEVLVDGRSVEFDPSKTEAIAPVRDENEPYVYDENGNAVEKFRPIGFPLSGNVVFEHLPLLIRPNDIGEFSKLEITMAIVEQGAPNPFS